MFFCTRGRLGTCIEKHIKKEADDREQSVFFTPVHICLRRLGTLVVGRISIGENTMRKDATVCGDTYPSIYT